MMRDVKTVTKIVEAAVKAAMKGRQRLFAVVGEDGETFDVTNNHWLMRLPVRMWAEVGLPLGQSRFRGNADGTVPEVGDGASIPDMTTITRLPAAPWHAAPTAVTIDGSPSGRLWTLIEDLPDERPMRAAVLIDTQYSDLLRAVTPHAGRYIGTGGEAPIYALDAHGALVGVVLPLRSNHLPIDRAARSLRLDPID